MDIFNTTYYNINKNLHRLLGCWPYQRRCEKYILRVLVFSWNISILIPEIIHFIYVRNDWDLVIEHLPIFIIHTIHIFKYFTYVLNGDKMEELFSMIKDDWLHVSMTQEKIIMHKYAATGKNISLIYVFGYYGLVTTYLIVTIAPRVLDVWLPLNQSRPFIYIFGAEYYIDTEIYYTPIIIHQMISALIAITSIIATDATYSVYAHHACGMFAVVKYRLSYLTFHDESNDSSSYNRIEYHKQIIDCIEKHKTAIGFCETLESAHVFLMFVILLTGVMGLSITGVQAVSSLNRPLEALRSAVLCMGHFMHIYYYSWNSQKILDHSSDIFDAAYSCKWYAILDKTAKLLSFIMLRSSKPCIQTAGTMFPMTLINFTVIVKTSMSYFTVITNFQ